MSAFPVTAKDIVAAPEMEAARARILERAAAEIVPAPDILETMFAIALIGTTTLEYPYMLEEIPKRPIRVVADTAPVPYGVAATLPFPERVVDTLPVPVTAEAITPF
jgi:hypothetical protein